MNEVIKCGDDFCNVEMMQCDVRSRTRTLGSATVLCVRDDRTDSV